MSLSFLIIGFLVCASSLNILNTHTLVEENHDHCTIDTFDYSTWQWSSTEVVSTESTNHSSYPSLAVDTLGNIHVAWEDWTNIAGAGTDYDIFCKYWDASTESWTPTEVVSTESTNDSYYPSIAVDSAGNVHITWYDLTDYAGAGTDADIFYKRWNASTSLWTSTEVVSAESTEVSFRASLALDAAGNVHIAWIDGTDYASSGIDSDIFYKRWNASTSSWITTEVVSTESTDPSYSSSLVVDSEGNIHIAWEDYTDYASAGIDADIFYKRWNTSTSLWTITEVVSTESTSGSYDPTLTIDSAGNVHIVWEDFTDYASAGIDADIFYKHWNTSTSSWTMTEIVSTESTSGSYDPTLTIDSTGNVHIAWHDYTDYASAGIDADIFYKRWNSSTPSWTITEVVSIEITGDSGYPSLAVDATGNVHVAWHDHTDYAVSGTDWDIFYKHFAGPPIAPVLSPILPNPTNIATISLDWNDVPGASLYYIYRSTSNIVSVEGFTPIGNTVISSYDDTLPTEGTFYYVIVANNFAGNSTPSNCESIVYEPPDVYEYGTSLGLMLASFAFLIVILRTRKKNSKLN